MSELFQESGCSRRNWSGGPPETSNCYCHPGKAGGTPWDFSMLIHFIFNLLH